MKQILLSVLLLSSVNVFAKGDLREVQQKPTVPKLERSWQNYAKLMWAAFKLDRLGRKHNKAVEEVKRVKTDHFNKKKLLENNSRLKECEDKKVDIKKEFEQKSQEFTEMQKSLFNVSFCNPKIITYNIFDGSYVECGVTDDDLSGFRVFSGRCTQCAWKEIQLFNKRLTKEQLDDDSMDWVHCQQ